MQPDILQTGVYVSGKGTSVTMHDRAPSSDEHLPTTSPDNQHQIAGGIIGVAVSGGAQFIARSLHISNPIMCAVDVRDPGSSADLVDSRIDFVVPPDMEGMDYLHANQHPCARTSCVDRESDSYNTPDAHNAGCFLRVGVCVACGASVLLKFTNTVGAGVGVLCINKEPQKGKDPLKCRGQALGCVFSPRHGCEGSPKQGYEAHAGQNDFMHHRDLDDDVKWLYGSCHAVAVLGSNCHMHLVGCMAMGHLDSAFKAANGGELHLFDTKSVADRVGCFASGNATMLVAHFVTVCSSQNNGVVVRDDASAQLEHSSVFSCRINGVRLSHSRISPYRSKYAEANIKYCSLFNNRRHGVYVAEGGKADVMECGISGNGMVCARDDPQRCQNCELGKKSCERAPPIQAGLYEEEGAELIEEANDIMGFRDADVFRASEAVVKDSLLRLAALRLAWCCGPAPQS